MLFDLTPGNMVANNLAGQGPLDTAEEMRFSKAGKTSTGTEFDLVLKVLDTQDEYKPDKPELNTAEGGHGFQIHFGVIADPNKLVNEVEFEFSFEDQEGKAVELELASFLLFDIDHDRKNKLAEIACYNVDQLDVYNTQIPGFDPIAASHFEEQPLPGFEGSQVTTTYDKTKECDGTTSTGLGSVRVVSNQVGFGCDFKKDLDLADFKPVLCDSDQCQNDDPALKCNQVKHHFGYTNSNNENCDPYTAAECDNEQGINPLHRMLKTSFAGKSSFRVTLGIKCDKGAGKTCTRNFEFRGEHQYSSGKCS